MLINFLFPNTKNPCGVHHFAHINLSPVDCKQGLSYPSRSNPQLKGLKVSQWLDDTRGHSLSSAALTLLIEWSSHPYHSCWQMFLVPCLLWGHQKWRQSFGDTSLKDANSSTCFTYRLEVFGKLSLSHRLWVRPTCWLLFHCACILWEMHKHLFIVII